MTPSPVNTPTRTVPARDAVPSPGLFFISYAHKDGTAFAQQLREEIGRAGYGAWLDQDGIQAGDVWLRNLDEGIRNCHALLAVITSSYEQSKFCLNELLRAEEHKKPIIPLLVTSGATRPLNILSLQYVDCTSLAIPVRETVAAIIQYLEHGPTSVPDLTIVERTTAQARRFVQQRQGTPQRPGVYLAALHSPRSVAIELDRFMESPARVMLLLGGAGAGKTSVLCHWISAIANRGECVLAYDCGELRTLDRDLGLDLGTAAGESLEHSVAAAAAQADAAQRKLVLVFDALEEFSGTDRSGFGSMLQDINAILTRIDAPNIRILLSCRTVAWLRQEASHYSHLDETLFYQSESGTAAVSVGDFSNEEFNQAYRLYRAHFNLQTLLEEIPAEARTRLREPDLLRLAAESHRGQKLDVTSDGLDLQVYWKYFDNRVQSRAERIFVDHLSKEMLQRRTASIALADLPANETWANEVWQEDASTPYNTLVDRGVLDESRARLNTFVRFSHPQTAAYAFAQHLLEREAEAQVIVRSLIDQTSAFPIAWETAKTVLLLKLTEAPAEQNAPLVTSLAKSDSAETRALLADSLVELHGCQPEKAAEYVARLFGGRSQHERRTAIKAAYKIGPAARPHLLSAATGGDADLRRLVRNTLYIIWRAETFAGRLKTTDSLYLIWRHAPGFTYQFLEGLLDRIGVFNAIEMPSILEFVLDLSTTIYVNHCESREVRDRTAALYKDLAVNRLHLNLVGRGPLAPLFELGVSTAVSRMVSTQVLEWALFSGEDEGGSFFSLTQERRACLARIAEALDPATSLRPFQEELRTMLDSGVPIFRGAAALTIAIHACHEFGAVEPLIIGLFDAVSSEGRLWMLAGFSVLLPDTPATWIPRLETFTERCLAESGGRLSANQPRLAFDPELVLLPLGLAYGKAGRELTYFSQAITQARATNQDGLAALLVRATGAAGYYYPPGAFGVLRHAMPGAGDTTAFRDAIVDALATIRTLHFDAVDDFLREREAPEALRHSVDAATSVDRVSRLVHFLGYYNNAVHLCLRYPRMRRQLSADLLRRLATADSLKEVAVDYTKAFIHMFRQADFDLLKWTDAE